MMPTASRAIEDHAVIGDLHTAALVATDGLRGPVRGGPDQAAVYARYQRARDQVPGHRLGR